MMRKYPALALALALSACSLAPTFTKPDINIPENYTAPEGTLDLPYDPSLWKRAVPMDSADKGEWWKIFGDARLNMLEAQAMKNSPTLDAATARVEEARGALKAGNSTLFPQIDLGANAVRTQPSAASLAGFGGVPAASRLDPYTLYSVDASASYELDLFGRVRNTEHALFASEQAEEAMLASVTLSLQADVAQHYFALRAVDAEMKLLMEAVATRREASRIMKKRFDVGAAGEQDYTRVAADLANTEAEYLQLRQQRAGLEHGLAVLLGEMPSGFRFVEAPLDGMPPEIPSGLPSELLERRPDVAQAQQQMAAANAQVGVARTAFFPRVILQASGALESVSFSDIFDWSQRTWALGQLAGDAISMTLFDAGRNQGRLDTAEATYQEAVASYRNQVLAAFRDVEDNLSAQRLLAEQVQKLDEAAKSASRTTAIAQKRYDEGGTSYFEVVDAQRTSLAFERAAVQAKGQRFVTAVALVRSLGGGWHTSQLQVHP